jgi:hypothetical protein
MMGSKKADDEIINGLRVGGIRFVSWVCVQRISLIIFSSHSFFARVSKSKLNDCTVKVRLSGDDFARSDRWWLNDLFRKCCQDLARKRYDPTFCELVRSISEVYRIWASHRETDSQKWNSAIFTVIRDWIINERSDPYCLREGSQNIPVGVSSGSQVDPPSRAIVAIVLPWIWSR